ncbi:Crp/Fnr family transcriptional regulator [Lichenifustis flavocetrariae]|uniref:Crp/Fnr family transcriptional regulator n=1 Tax=Lichenifustis flavocetrariae TaxID=2949735 RepID=A0AA41YSW9_9HYPH|nr:Crp/Fnr family transcriptional regulator [Lichenifustis flavocetrariae]MCW6506720.1 Crp/Fnr family transcriptional regulator [Lichenifustis flavocetrariae]
MKTQSSHAPEFAVLLRINPLFGDLDPNIIAGLAGLCSTRCLTPKEVLFRKGDPGDALYGIRRGQIGIEFWTRNGTHVTLNTLGSGDIFGEVAMLDGCERTADAVALEATELFSLRREHVIAHLEREPSIALKFIELLCKRLRYMSGRMEEVVSLKMGARLARRLLVLSEDFGSDVTISQEQLAAHVGAARESVNRQLQLWHKSGILDLRRGTIAVKNTDALAAEARKM